MWRTGIIPYADVGGSLPCAKIGEPNFDMFSSPRQLCVITFYGKGGESVFVTWELLFAYDMTLLTLAALVISFIALVINIIALVISIVNNIKK